jgi:hypothetical protein
MRRGGSERPDYPGSDPGSFEKQRVNRDGRRPVAGSGHALPATLQGAGSGCGTGSCRVGGDGQGAFTWFRYFPTFHSRLFPWPIGSLNLEEGGMETSAMLGNWMIYLLWSASAFFVVGSVLNAMRYTHPLTAVKGRQVSR